MQELLTLSRAARLVGVTRGVLQKRIQDDELETFEGKVKVSDLLRAFPEARLDDDSALERVNRIKAAATPRTESKAELPAKEVLASRLTSLSFELVEARTELEGCARLLRALEERLSGLRDCEPARLPAELDGLLQWLRAELPCRPPVSARTTELLARDTFLRMLAAQVKVIPSGHEFFVEGTDSILEAALAAGLKLKYGCTSGSCGSCKARVVSGDVLKVRDHDYVIGATERALGYMLMCSYTAVTDLTIEAGEAHGAADIPAQEIPARVRQVTRASADLAVLQLQTPRTRSLRFLAGQRVTLESEDGARADLPVASCPCDGRNLEFHLRRHQSSAFAEEVFSGRVRESNVVTVRGPEGDFVLDEDLTRPILFLAYDEGFAPIKSLVENAISIDNVTGYRLLWGVPEAGGHYMSNRCRAWADALDNFAYTPLVHGLDAAPETLANLFERALEDPSDLARWQVYAAGPAPFLAGVEALLQRHRVPSSQGRYLRTDPPPLSG